MLTPQDLINIIKIFFEFNNLNFEDFKTELVKQIKENRGVKMTFEEAFEYYFKYYFNDDFNCYDYYDVFDNFLIWDRTTKGHDYWNNIDSKFIKEFEKYKKLYLNKMFED